MTALAPTAEPSQLLHALDFASKGLANPTFLDYQPSDGKEARFLVRALYHGPRPGWPALDREAVRAIAYGVEGTANGTETSPPNVDGRQTIDGNQSGRTATPICLAETNPTYPVPVIVSIALVSQPGACAAALKNIHALSQLYVNGYRPFQLPVATWRTAEGVWCIVKDGGSVKLRNWWEIHARPPMEESESRWRIWSWRRDSLPKNAVGENLVNGQQVEGDQGKPMAVQQRDDEQESMTIDRGWLQAVEILIQMADILLVRSCRVSPFSVNKADLRISSIPVTPRAGLMYRRIFPRFFLRRSSTIVHSSIKDAFRPTADITRTRPPF